MSDLKFTCQFCHRDIGEPAEICPWCGNELRWDTMAIKQYRKVNPDFAPKELDEEKSPGLREKLQLGRIAKIPKKLWKFIGRIRKD